jgi:sugar phosphate isomerase/epimerase
LHSANPCISICPESGTLPQKAGGAGGWEGFGFGPAEEEFGMSKVSRREFLKNSSALAAAAAAGGTQPLFASPSEPALKFPTAARDRLSVISWPFRAFIESPTNRWARDRKQPGMDLKDFAAMVVKRFGVHNIEPLGEHFRSTDPAYLAEFRETVEKAGSHIVDIATGSRDSYYDPDPRKRQPAVENAKKWVDIAVTLGSPSIRTHIEGSRSVKPDVDRAAESLKRLADYGAEKNILINLENDDNDTEDPFFIVQVLEKVNHPYLHALPDFCNSMLTHDQDFNNHGLEAMFKHAYNIAHMKDSEVDNNKVYTVDVAKCFEIAKASDYRGYFSMEWEGQGGPYEGTQRLIELSLKYLG